MSVPTLDGLAPLAIEDEGTEDAALYRKVTRRILPLACLGFLAAYIDRANVGFAKLQMLGDLRWTESIYGFGAGLFFLGYIACEIPSNLILHRVGATLWLARIMVTWGLVSGMMVFVSSPGSYYMLRLLLGVAEAGFMPGVLYLLASWYPRARLSQVTALFMLGIPMASAVSGPVSGAIMSALQGVGHLAGWQWLFLIEAVPAIVLGLCTYFMVPRSPATAAWLTAAEKSRIAARLDADLHDPDAHKLKRALANPLIWLIGVIDAALLLGLYSVAFWLPTFIRNTGVADPFTIGCLTTIPHLAAIIAMIVVGRHSDRKRERRWHVAVPMLVGAAALALSPLASGRLVPTVLAFSIANAAILSAIPPLWCVPGTFLRGAAAAAGLALAGSLANLAGFFSTSFVGWLLDVAHSANVALIVFAVCLAAGAGLALAMPRAVVNR